MHAKCTQSGIAIGEKYLSAHEALDLLQWLSQRGNTLWYMREEAEKKFHHSTAESQHKAKQFQGEMWTPAELQELCSEDEQIVNIEL